MRKKPYVNWHWSDTQQCWLLKQGARTVANVWNNGTWHTWDRDGIGGENSVEETMERAKVEAAASAIEQGFI